ncbi:50S ribosomal protein L18 [Epulopiscium sp. SCG-B10WGA-EpuloA2]|nr:50S ribosomal protein L18 [Epulopiscium sp. SCG-B10WGA-EpuloA2]ONI45352.1 50S ribosomal protein L18 [Epulopiscium sp. SCG-C07WGA-EpuloA2]
MVHKESRTAIREKKHKKIRNKISGTSSKPRLSVFRSEKHIYAQVIDDSKGVTLASASSIAKGQKLEDGADIEAAKKVGSLVAKNALEKGIIEVVFDRGGFIYHGRVKALAEAAREAGLKF